MALSTFAHCSVNKADEPIEYLNGTCTSNVGSETAFDDFYSSPTDQETVDCL